MGGGLSLISTVVYLTWAAPLTQVKVGETIGPADNVLVDNQVAQVGETIATGQQILTLPAARVGLKQADQVIARLGSQAAATLERDCIQLGEGQLVVAGVPGCVGAAIVQGEGAIVVLERLGTLGEVKVLAGEVSLSLPSNPALGTITLRKNQKITLSLTGDEIGPVRLMLPTEVDGLLAGELFQGFQVAIANQAALMGLAPPAAPSPPAAVVKPAPIPAKRLPTTPPADKVPPAQPAPPSHPPVFSEPRSQHRPTSASDYGKEAEPDSSYRSSYPINASAAEFYHRPTRRRRSAGAVYESFSYSRPRSRSTHPGYYSGHSYRRRPAYSAPSHSAPTQPSTPTAPKPNIPSVPEAPAPEMPTPIELPPAMPPVSEPLPPPAIAEPPLEVPPLK